jgi:hypothetical protein
VTMTQTEASLYGWVVVSSQHLIRPTLCKGSGKVIRNFLMYRLIHSASQGLRIQHTANQMRFGGSKFNILAYFH